MAPIRVALIGLSASAKTSWAVEGHLPYLLSPKGKSKYQIVALLNSSVDAAKDAIATFELPASTKAYGDPQDLANDPDIDLVVNNTRTDVHYGTIKPSIEAGKHAYVEWPLAHSVPAAIELRDLAAKKYVRTMVGLQGRLSPVILKVSEVLGDGENGKIGKVLSSDARAFGSLLRRDRFSEGLAYFADRKIGGHPVSIHFGHMIDFIHSVLGEFSSFQSHAQVQRPEVFITSGHWSSSNDTSSVAGTIKSDVPDLVSVQGTLKSSDLISEGATLTVTYRNGPSFPGTPAFVWTIAGTKGELRVTSPEGPYLQSHCYGSDDKPAGIKIEVHNYGSNTVETVPWHWSDLQKSLDMRFAHSGGKAPWPTFGDAVVRHKQIAQILKAFDEKSVTS
ncbi:NAD(P)-binding protein [Viridothelium virens]|uniref:NAD(P)-binding protein n=1 Tax=Viridothelium virens TaxID=1048519 RepID=A0A6A6H2C2_VIRVR|nr:NAD(P)-binding protein [Viridothelium virens]